MEHLSSCLVLYREHMDSICLLNVNDSTQDSKKIKQTVSSSFFKEENKKASIFDKKEEITETGICLRL